MRRRALAAMVLVGLLAAGSTPACAGATGSAVQPTEPAAGTAGPLAPTEFPAAGGLAAYLAGVAAAAEAPEGVAETQGAGHAPAAPAIPASASRDVRLRIPGIALDAVVVPMGVTATGVMEVPASAALVAWYTFSAFPGGAGNAVMAAHVDYRGSAGAFSRLSRLQPGDEVIVTVAGEPLRYLVERTYLVEPDAVDLEEVIGRRAGDETLTLITCGGDFDRSQRAYDRRVVVRATRVD